MLCVEEITALIKQCTDDGWSDCFSAPLWFQEEQLIVLRWVHLSSSLGFVCVFSRSKRALSASLLRDRVQFFRHWKGKNLGFFCILEGGLEPNAAQSLPYYGHLRTAILDFSTERILYGSDSSKFQFMVGAIASFLGIPSGGNIGSKIQSMQYNRMGPRSWNRKRLQVYENANLLEWHPLWITASFTGLELGLDSCLYYQNNVLSLFPESFPLCSYPLRALQKKHPDKNLIVLYAHSLTSAAEAFAAKHGISHHHITKDVGDTLQSLGFQPTPIEIHDQVFWHPILWVSYLAVLQPIQSYRVVEQAVIVNQEIAYVSALTHIQLTRTLTKLSKELHIVVHSNFSVAHHVFEAFQGWVWIYRDEIFQSFSLPLAIQNAFMYFNSFSPERNMGSDWKDRIVKEKEGWIDRKDGYRVEVHRDIPSDHPWLIFGFQLSMHAHTIPFLYYDSKEEILAVRATSGHPISVEEAEPIRSHLHRCMNILGIPTIEEGRFLLQDGRVVMSLMDFEEEK